jgi:uncharacterized membrane protein YphA (DoxX/SURF4 family)
MVRKADRALHQKDSSRLARFADCSSDRKTDKFLVMQRLFSVFPTGIPGIGLFLLRVSVAAVLLVDGTAHWTLVMSWWTFLLVAVSAGALCLGFLTPYVALLCCVVELGVLWTTKAEEFHLIIALASSAVVAMVGPGAYSLDARIFGRRLLRLPVRNRGG